MLINRNSKQSLKLKLNKIVMVVVFAFALIAVTILFTSRSVRLNVDHAVENSLQQAITSSQNSRDFGLLNARLSIFKASFDFDDKGYEVETKEVLADIENLRNSVADPDLKEKLELLNSQFSTYLKGREWVNYLLFWRSEQDKDLTELFLLLHDVIADKIKTTTLIGGEIQPLENLLALIPDFRVSIFEIIKINAEENPSRLLFDSSSVVAPLEVELTNLSLRLHALSTAVPPIDRLGKHLTDHLTFYRYRMEQYRAEMAHLGVLDGQLRLTLGQISSAMESLDKETVATIEATKHKIDNTIMTMVISVQFFLFALAVAFWFYLRSFFKHHIQEPITLIGSRLANFEQGDHSSRMQLGRDDEWGEIEAVFDKMVASIQESVNSLEKSESRYRDIFDNASDGIFQATISGKILKVNQAAVRMFGYDLTDVEKASDYNLESIYYRTADRDGWLKMLRQQGDVHGYEVQLCRRDGSIFWASISGHMVRNADGRVAYVEGIVRDVSHRKEAHEQIEQLQSHLQNIIDSMPSILIGVDGNMKVTLWNKRAEEESLLAATAAKGYAMSTVCYLFDFSVYMLKLEETLRTGIPARMQKVESVKRNSAGRKRYFDILIYPLSMNGSNGAVIHMEDVTEKLQMEEMMVRSEKMQSIGGLAAGLAHEINNPLAVILQNIQVVNRRLSPSLDKNRQVAEELGTTIETIVEYNQLRGCDQMINSVADAGQRVAKIVENIQSFSQSGISNFIPCALTTLLERTIELAGSDYDMRHKYNFKHITIVRDYQSVPDVCCEASQIQQVLLGLLKNAAQALMVRTEGQQITLSLTLSDNDHVCLKIADNGNGMEPETTAKIFDPFYTTQDVGGGFGLGLSIAYFIITYNHSGHLSVASEPGNGSCFEIVLPIKNGAVAEQNS